MLVRNIAIGVIGVLLGLFLVGPAVFADGSFNERLTVFGLIVIFYAAAGVLSGYLTGSRKSGIWLGLPGIVTGGLMSDAPRITIVVIVLVIVAAGLGVYRGVRLKARR
ncbi:MAG: DUF6954 family protein [Bacillota bacterium]